MVFLVCLDRHKSNHRCRACFSLHLLLNAHVQCGFFSFYLPLRSRSSHHDRSVDRIVRFGKLWDCQDRNSFCGQNEYLSKFRNSMLTLHASQIPARLYSLLVKLQGIPSRSHWCCCLVQHQNAQELERRFLSWFLIPHGLQVQ